MEAKNLADLYSLPLVEWSHIEARLAEGVSQAPETGGPNRHTCWLATINADGSPHVTAVGALWYDGTFWFETGKGTRKARNLAHDPRCTLSVATDVFDLVVEGAAREVTDPAIVAEMASRWAAAGWPCRCRRERPGAHRRVQCPVGRPAAVVRVSTHSARRDRACNRRIRWRDTLAVLKRAPRRSLDLRASAPCRSLGPRFKLRILFGWLDVGGEPRRHTSGAPSDRGPPSV